MAYLQRAIDARLDRLIKHAPAIALEGAKGVGKTATAAQRSDEVVRLDRRVGQMRFENDPDLQQFGEGTILIDEWQRVPESWDAVRRAVDDGADPGRFLLTGSATPMVGADTHSGAGRILNMRMRPMALFERGICEPTVSLKALLNGDADITGTTSWKLPQYVDAIAASGFPAITAIADEEAREEFLDSYIARIVDRDLPEQGYTTRNKASLIAWLRAYAAATASETSYTELLDAATLGESQKPRRKTTDVYRKKLEEIWILDPLPAWNIVGSALSRLSASPKHHLADPALAMRLLGLNAHTVMQDKNLSLLGALFESLATLQVRVAAEANRCTVSHFRALDGGREVDLIVEDPNGRILAIEVKMAATVKDDDAKHLHWLCQQLGDEVVVDRVIIYAGEHALRRPDGVAVIPLALLGA